MSEILVPILVALIVAIPSTIAAVAAWLQARATAKKTEENTVITQRTENKAVAIEKKTDVIHDLTNSNLKAVKDDLAQANTHIKELQALVASFVGVVKTVDVNDKDIKS